MADANADDVLRLIDEAARKQMSRDIDGLGDVIDNADQIAAQRIAEAAANLERTLAASGVDPLSSATA